MGKLEDLTFEKTDKGHLKICGKIREGNDILTGCIIVSGESGQPNPVSGEGHPKVQEELLDFAKKNIKVR
jgi:hypothetical protein